PSAGIPDRRRRLGDRRRSPLRDGPAGPQGPRSPTCHTNDDQGGCPMGQSPEELKDNIEMTRGELGETLDAIGDRVSPGRVIERRKNRVRAGVMGLRNRVMGTAQGTVDTAKERLTSTMDTVRDAPEAGLQQTQGHPMVAGALAFGIGFLIA